MKTISRYIMTLALLLTAAGGAWAQGEFSSDPYTSTTEFNSVSVTSSMTLTIKEGVIVTVNSGLTIEDGVTLTLTGGGKLSVYGKSGNWGRDASYEEGNRIIEATAGGDGNPAIILNDNAKIVIDNGEIYAEGGQGGFGGTDEIAGINKPDGAAGNAFSRFPTIDGATLYYKSSNEWFKYTSGDKTLYNVMKAVPPTFEVTLNDPKTEASFEMPTSDVDVSYELVRDITQKVDVETRIDGAVTERIRIAKDNDGHYKFATKQGWQFAAVDKLDNNKDLTNGELTYTLKMKVGDEYVAKNFDTELCPGTWRLEATANAEKPYEGTAYGPDIELYAGYEITVPAGEYATFYKDENLYTEDENAELYTISEVNATQAVLSDAVQIMPKNTPMLVYNKGTEEKTFLLIPTEDEANQVTAANEFKGTLSTMGMPGSTSITDYYVCTGKAFRWVKNAGTIGANKCWLQIGEQPATTRANTRSIVGGGNTTGIDGIENDESAVDGYYDLNGRKLQGKPTRGGIYIQNGRKVIVR